MHSIPKDDGDFRVLRVLEMLKDAANRVLLGNVVVRYKGQGMSFIRAVEELLKAGSVSSDKVDEAKDMIVSVEILCVVCFVSIL